MAGLSELEKEVFAAINKLSEATAAIHNLTKILLLDKTSFEALKAPQGETEKEVEKDPKAGWVKEPYYAISKGQLHIKAMIMLYGKPPRSPEEIAYRFESHGLTKPEVDLLVAHKKPGSFLMSAKNYPALCKEVGYSPTTVTKSHPKPSASKPPVTPAKKVKKVQKTHLPWKSKKKVHPSPGGDWATFPDEMKSQHLRKLLGVDVYQLKKLTAMPNFPKPFKATSGPLRKHRIWDKATIHKEWANILKLVDTL